LWIKARTLSWCTGPVTKTYNRTTVACLIWACMWRHKTVARYMGRHSADKPGQQCKNLYGSVTDALKQDACVMRIPLVINPRLAGRIRLANLYYAAHGHICEMCTYYKNFTIILAVRYTTYYFPRAAREPAHSNGCGALPEKVGDPCCIRSHNWDSNRTKTAVINVHTYYQSVKYTRTWLRIHYRPTLATAIISKDAPRRTLHFITCASIVVLRLIHTYHAVPMPWR
jgi:hypothetical protein